MSLPGKLFGWPGLRLLCAAGLLAVAIWAVVRAPHILIWYLAIGSTAFAPIVLLLAALLALPGTRGALGHVSLALALTSAALALSVLVRAVGHGDTNLPRLLTWPSTVPHETLTYRADPPLTLDLYRGPPGAPVIVFVHGGSRSSGDSSQLRPFAHELVGRGFSVASINYRLAPQHPFPAPLEDVHAAVRWASDQGDVILMGRSAGGHLALVAAYDGAPVKAVVALYAPTDMYWSWENPGTVLDTHATLRAFLGGAPDEVPSSYDAASPIRHVNRAVPTLLIHGGRDELVSPSQPVRLADALAGASVRHEVVMLPWATHAFDAHPRGPATQQALAAMERFLASP